MQIMLLLLLVIPATGACPIWTVHNKTSHCVCGDSSVEEVHCTLNPYQISVAPCFCMTYSDQLGQVTVGRCIITCTFPLSYHHHYIPIHTKQLENLNNETCGKLSRTGQLCGECQSGHAPPVLSYTLKCVRCTDKDFTANFFKFILLAFLPMTIIYFIVIVFQISITSNRMVVFVFTCQTLTAPYIIKALTHTLHNRYFVKLTIEYLSFWNMDLLRNIHDPFCLHPSLNIMQVIALDYVVAVYPMILIVITYIAVSLHDRYSLVLSAWRPMQRVLMCIRKKWNIRGSLVQAFATFLALSYVKILNVSLQLLNPVHIHETKYVQQLYYLYSAGTIKYFGPEHMPYGILALLMLLVFILIPTVFLALYPVNCFKNCLGINNSVTVATFMDAFAGCYRTQSTDYRPFAAVYFIARILQLLTFGATKDSSILVMTGYYLIFLSIMVYLMEPYADRRQNKLDALLLLNTATLFLLTPTHTYLTGYNPVTVSRDKIDVLFSLAIGTCLIIQIMYGVVLVMAKLLPRKLLKWLHKRRLKNRIDEKTPLIT